MYNTGSKNSLDNIRMSPRKLCDVQNCVSFVFASNFDNSILVSTDEPDVWLPNISVPFSSGFEAAVNNYIKEILSVTLQPERILKINKIWMPHHQQNYIYNFVLEIKCNSDNKKKMKAAGGKFKGQYKWVSEQELTKIINTGLALSPELLEFYNLSKNKNGVQSSDCYYVGNLMEINDNVLISSTMQMYDDVVRSADFNIDLQKELLSHFFMTCFPATCMSRNSFTKFMLFCGWPKDDAMHIFRAANLSNTGALTFREFLYVLAALEPKTIHGGLSAEIRCRYIFKFFDVDNDNSLNQNEFKNMVVYMRKAKGLPIDNQSVQTDVESYYKSFGYNTEGKPIGLADFLHAVGDLKLRGTSFIFRSPEAIKATLTRNKNILGTGQSHSISSHSPALSINSQGNKRKKELEISRGYDIAMHTMKLQKGGTLLTVEQVFNIDGAISLTTLKSYSPLESKKKASVEVFSQKSMPNEILKTLRQLCITNRSTTTFSWGPTQSSSFGHNLIQIAKQVREIMFDEARLIEIQSPVYIMGDFHGNFNDILNFEQAFWPLGPNLCPAHLLFLGDYVDRGVFSMEVIMYLFAYKVQAPQKITLLRGNHEIREIQKLFTFYAECIKKFGEKLGHDIWSAINNAFDVMPLAAVVDGKLFCCHGGIPPPWLCPAVAAINQIPVPLTRPDEQSTLAWELMWNDPIRTKQITEAISMELMANEGFAKNQRRGTAHVFNSDALERFLSSNNYTHLIRGHESAQAGFNFQQKGKVMTVFSSSHYCNGMNEAACLLADQEKIRIFRLEG